MQVHAVVVVRTLLGLLDHELPDELLKCCIVQIFRVVPQNFMLVCRDKALKWMSHCEERCVFWIVLLHKYYFRILMCENTGLWQNLRIKIKVSRIIKYTK